MTDLRCPICGSLLAKEFDGKVQVCCDKCHIEVKVTTKRYLTNFTVCDKREITT